VKECGADIVRFGCYKGQNYPVVNGKPEYLGLGDEGVKILGKIQNELNIPCVCDFQSRYQLSKVWEAKIKYLMIGARNMDNLALLRATRKVFSCDEIGRPKDWKQFRKIILKRGPSSTIHEFIGAAEHLGGPSKVILCERGTVHFDRHDYTRYRLDFVGVAEIKHYHPEYRIIIDPSHGSGDRNLILSLSKAALSISDGLMVEVHYDPDSSPTDAPQTIDFPTFKEIGEYYDKL
ncbi:hypothetical protein LCGC14_2924800, partial [marine sediment metagenome]